MDNLTPVRHSFAGMALLHRQRPGWRFPTAVRAEGVWIWDADVRRLLDAAGGALVVNVCHGVGEIAKAIAEQARTLASASPICRPSATSAGSA
jgi:adenosylmethionine-8-amino-7-oxononanoate aminotransferase